MMKRILVIQTFRYGDLLQSTPAIGALRRHEPEAEITVLTRRPFGEVLQGNPDVNAVVQWDLEPFDVLAREQRVPGEEQMEALRRLVRPLLERRFDGVVNLANDFPSALLAGLIRPRRMEGLIFCRDGRYRVRNEWLRYLFISTEARLLNGINLADIFAESCGGSDRQPPKLPLTAADRRWAAGLLAGFAGTGRAPVGLQVGASKDFKRWPAAHFVEVARRLLGGGHPLLLFGSAAERPLVNAVVAALPEARARVRNLAGETTFARLGAVLERCRLLISNDTATVHAAAAVGTPSLVITFGPTSAWETAPYAEGHYVLEPVSACFPCNWSKLCPDLPCRDRIGPDDVWRAAWYALCGSGSAAPPASGRVRLYRTAWMPDGLLGLQPVNRPELEIRDLLRAMIRTYFVSHRLRRRGESPRHEWRPWLDEMLTWHRVTDVAALSVRVRHAAMDLGALRRLARTGARAAATLILNGLQHVEGAPLQRLVASLSRLEERILASEENESLRFLVAGFHHALRDMEQMPLGEAVVAHRWNFLKLSEACGYVGAALDAFARQAAIESEAAAGATRAVPGMSLEPREAVWHGVG